MFTRCLISKGRAGEQPTFTGGSHRLFLHRKSRHAGFAEKAALQQLPCPGCRQFHHPARVAKSGMMEGVHHPVS